MSENVCLHMNKNISIKISNRSEFIEIKFFSYYQGYPITLIMTTKKKKIKHLLEFLSKQREILFDFVNICTLVFMCK